MSVALSPDDSGSATVATVTGEIDMATAGILARELENAIATSTCLVVDLSGITFVDSSGLETFDQVRRSAVEAQADLRFAGATEQLIRVLRITNLLEGFNLYPDVASALAEA